MSNESLIGRRLKALREGKRLTQADMARLLGLKDRQSVSQIENGTRRVTAAELVTAIRHFGVTLEEVTNPYILSDKNSFSWRQNNVSIKDLDAFERLAGEWIGAYRELNRLLGVPQKRLLPRLGLTYSSSLEDGVAAGEAVAHELRLGVQPAKKLAEVMEKDLGILVIMVDATIGISGAACRLPQLNVVLVNRTESRARRNSDLGHELFHLLTWDEMKPARIESSTNAWDEPRTHLQQRNQRIEQLADNFASGLLMPSTALDRLGEPKGDLVEWLTAGAAELGVSSLALKWRLVNGGRFPAARSVSKLELGQAAKNAGAEQVPPAFSRVFIDTIAKGAEAGHISASRACELLRLKRSQLEALCDTYEVRRPVELGGSFVESADAAA